MSSKNDTQVFLDFLRFSISETAEPPQSIAQMDWDKLFKFGAEQTIIGVLFYGLEKLKDIENKPNREQLMKFFSYATRLEQANKRLYKDAVAVSKFYKEQHNIDVCVLKGQANSRLYPTPYMRTPGDIDLWSNQDKVKLIRAVRQYDKEGILGYHHIQTTFGEQQTPIELHFFPSFMGNLFYEYRLRKFFDKHSKRQFQNKVELPDNFGTITVMTTDVDVVFQLSHLMHHFFFEGIGFRQMIDLYYLLQRVSSEEEKAEIVRTVKHTNMYKFASGVMYIMHNVLGLDKQYLLMPPNEKVGQLIESEILLSGNFGFHDKRYKFAGKSVYSQYFVEIYRNLHFALDFPSETIWGRPISRWWHMIYKFWLKKKSNC